MPYLITVDHLKAIAGTTTTLMTGICEWINATCPDYEIDAANEYAHFLAQACHETDRFRTLREYGKASYFARYEGRKDLGNTVVGDGARFKGRGIFQTTGRANYQQLGLIKGRRDLFIDSPELLEAPKNAVWSACEYWRTRGLNDIANHLDTDRLRMKRKGVVIEVPPVEYISLRINGGYNGMEDRKERYRRAKEVLV